MTPRFEQQLGKLCAAFNLPCTAERVDAYGTAFGKLPELAWERLVEHCLGESGPDKMPTVRELWGIRRDMRASGRSSEPTQSELIAPYGGDMWDIAANLHLLKHIAVRINRASRCYGTPATYRGMRASKLPNADASREWVGNIGDLVHAKNAWAADMRDLAASNGGEVPEELQRQVWADHIGRAEGLVQARMQPA